MDTCSTAVTKSMATSPDGSLVWPVLHCIRCLPYHSAVSFDPRATWGGKTTPFRWPQFRWTTVYILTNLRRRSDAPFCRPLRDELRKSVERTILIFPMMCPSVNRKPEVNLGVSAHRTPFCCAARRKRKGRAALDCPFPHFDAGECLDKCGLSGRGPQENQRAVSCHSSRKAAPCLKFSH